MYTKHPGISIFRRLPKTFLFAKPIYHPSSTHRFLNSYRFSLSKGIIYQAIPVVIPVLLLLSVMLRIIPCSKAKNTCFKSSYNQRLGSAFDTSLLHILYTIYDILMVTIYFYLFPNKYVTTNG
jgi:hypothetical protein